MQDELWHTFGIQKSLQVTGTHTPAQEDLGQHEAPPHLEFGAKVEFQAIPPYLKVHCGMVTFRFFQRILNNCHEITGMPNLLQRLETLSESSVLICLIRNGYVAMALLNAANREIIKSKCIKRYTTRRGQGYSQSKSDNAKGARYSAGAALRRHNELALIEEVGVLLRAWWDEILVCYAIFWIDTDFSRQCLFANGICELGRNDPRLCTIPLTTGRPNSEEMRRCIDMLLTVEVSPSDKEHERA